MKTAKLLFVCLTSFALAGCSSSSGNASSQAPVDTSSEPVDESKWQIAKNEWEYAFSKNGNTSVTINIETTYTAINGGQTLSTGTSKVMFEGLQSYYAQTVTGNIPDHVSFEVYYFSTTGGKYRQQARLASASEEEGYTISLTTEEKMYSYRVIDSFKSFINMYDDVHYDSSTKSYRYNGGTNNKLAVWFEDQKLVKVDVTYRTEYPTISIQHSIYEFTKRNETTVSFPTIPPLEYKLKEDDTYEVSLSQWTGDIPQELTIPATHLGKDVTSIAERGFMSYTGNSISIPDSVTEFGKSAFWGAKIKQITLPKELIVIPEECFLACNELERITFNNKLERVEKDAFKNCSALTSLNLPSSLKYLGDSLYESGVTELVLPDELENFDYGIFDSTTNITTLTVGKKARCYEEVEGGYEAEFIWIPSKITRVNYRGTINDFAQFAYVVKSPESNVFELYFGDTLADFTNIELSGFEKVGEYAFLNHPEIETITVGEGIKTIGYGAFCGGDKRNHYTSVVISDDVETIDTWAFRDCNIDSLVLGSGIKFIGYQAFDRGDSWNIVYHGTVAEWEQVEFEGDWQWTSGTVTCTDGTTEFFH